MAISAGLVAISDQHRMSRPRQLMYNAMAEIASVHQTGHITSDAAELCMVLRQIDKAPAVQIKLRMTVTSDSCGTCLCMRWGCDHVLCTSKGGR